MFTKITAAFSVQILEVKKEVERTWLDGSGRLFCTFSDGDGTLPCRVDEELVFISIEFIWPSRTLSISTFLFCFYLYNKYLLHG